MGPTPFCPPTALALGLSGDKAPLRPGVGMLVGFRGSSPVTLLRNGARPTTDTGRPVLSA